MTEVRRVAWWLYWRTVLLAVVGVVAFGWVLRWIIGFARPYIPSIQTDPWVMLLVISYILVPGIYGIAGFVAFTVVLRSALRRNHLALPAAPASTESPRP